MTARGAGDGAPRRPAGQHLPATWTGGRTARRRGAARSGLGVRRRVGGQRRRVTGGSWDVRFGHFGSRSSAVAVLI